MTVGAFVPKGEQLAIILISLWKSTDAPVAKLIADAVAVNVIGCPYTLDIPNAVTDILDADTANSWETNMTLLPA